MQTYIVHWQFPDQESHMQGAEAFAGFVEGGCEGDEFDGFKVLNRVLNPEGANGWAIVESSNHQNIWKWSSEFHKSSLVFASKLFYYYGQN